MISDDNKQYASIIRQIKYFREAQLSIEPAIEQYRLSIESLRPAIEQYQLSIESLRPAIEQYQLNARIVSEYLPPLINFWQKGVEQNAVIFDRFTEFWQTFQKQYRIPEQEAILILRKHKWFITPSLPLVFVFEAVKIGRRSGNQRGAINRLFVDYFSTDNFKNLENLVNGWETDKIFTPRMKIFRDCVFAMKNTKGYNASNIVLPTLIAQINGIQTEFMVQNGLSFKKGKLKNKNGEVVKMKEYFKNLTSNDKMLDLANDIFLKILFQRSLPGKPLENPFYFNRHKILHGEYFRYGRIENTIRAFLILDFLATLSNKGSKS